MMLTDIEMIFRLTVAFVVSGLIGLEREVRRHEAGLRTHIMVCLGSTLIMLTSLHLFAIYKAHTALDPSRMAMGVITGIGFLGAGTIMRSQEHIRGLTTAATLWVVAALGLAIGCGFFKTSCYVTALILLVLLFLRRIEFRMHKKGVSYGNAREEEGD